MPKLQKHVEMYKKTRPIAKLNKHMPSRYINKNKNE